MMALDRQTSAQFVPINARVDLDNGSLLVALLDTVDSSLHSFVVCLPFLIDYDRFGGYGSQLVGESISLRRR
jgi:hypothetical protein